MIKTKEDFYIRTIIDHVLLDKEEYEKMKKKIREYEYIIHDMPLFELRMKNRFPVDCLDKNEWYLYKTICYYGGCNLDGEMFPTEREALYEGVKLSLSGKIPDIGKCKRCCDEIGMLY